MNPAETRHVAVIDIGKTNAKLALVDLKRRTEIAAIRQPNRPRTQGPYPHHDVEALWSFVLDGLATLRRDHPIDAVSVTTHGATAALIDRQGDLVLPVLDYEHEGPDDLRADYEAIRPPFAETGSPRLPAGLNLGAQIFWLQQTFPDAFATAHAFLTYPQYWTYRLTGVVASEATSLGCHTDLWNPQSGDFSTLADAAGWRKLFPPLRRAGAVLGPVLPQIAARTGLDPATPVVCGIHDSNASLLPHLETRKPPFAVVSTGTWVVAMAVGSGKAVLDPARDTLINVNAHSDPVASARFMGGREFETVMKDAERRSNDADLEDTLSQSIMLLPSVQQGSGPFPDHAAEWLGEEPAGGRRYVAASFYLALMTATCLDLIGADGAIVVEGPFAANAPYLSMLSAATGRPVAAQEEDGTGTSVGAALLAGRATPPAPPAPAAPIYRSALLRQYAENWRSSVAARTTPPGR
ncbi:FGGY-family carbohydrate kinase [Mesorhizobium xinjiangense]|uniref:FGGY-family carbohydrate kinase n=1 Tax=Mesorhizobium xinjiangense TaxID=2678685 RepID=UPI0012EE35E8|nr:FGGY-family carbohydrate kinase [Mesorhizobium xinjiangense]